MKKNIIILIIILLSQFKNNKKFIFSESKIINIKNSDFNKNYKNYKRKYSASLFRIIGGLSSLGKRRPKTTLSHPLDLKLFKKITLPLNKLAIRFVNKFDFNAFNLVFYGC
jgi:hypothetical protein